MREDIPFAKDDIEAAEKQADTYDWMLDALTMLLATPKGIERLASGRNSRWERKLRKTKQGVAMKRLAFQRDLELARSEVERERLIKEFCRDIRARHDETERQIRLDRNYKDFVLSRWIHRWELGTPQPIENAQSGDKSG